MDRSKLRMNIADPKAADNFGHFQFWMLYPHILCVESHSIWVQDDISFVFPMHGTTYYIPLTQSIIKVCPTDGQNETFLPQKSTLRCFFYIYCFRVLCTMGIDGRFDWDTDAITYCIRYQPTRQTPPTKNTEGGGNIFSQRKDTKPVELFGKSESRNLVFIISLSVAQISRVHHWWRRSFLIEQ